MEVSNCSRVVEEQEVPVVPTSGTLVRPKEGVLVFAVFVLWLFAMVMFFRRQIHPAHQ